MKNYDAVVVGAGLAGCATANILAEKGLQVLVIEKRKQIGGQCFDYKDQNNITVHKYGPHIFHTKRKKVWTFVNRFSSFNDYQHRVLSYTNGIYYPFPINRKTLSMVFGENYSNTKAKEKLVEIAKEYHQNTSSNFEEAMVKQIGKDLYELFIKGYTQKQWEVAPSELSKDLAGRIPIRFNDDDRYFTDKYQGLPLNGYSAMMQEMLNHDNIHILLGCDYFEIKEKINSSILIYTGKLDEYFDHKYGKLQYRAVEFDIQTIDQESYLPAAVVNYPNDYDWTRITEFKKLTQEKSEKTVLCYEYPSDSGIPSYIIPDERNSKLREKYLVEVLELEKKGEVFFIGRLAEYKYYNMDRVIERAIDKLSHLSL
jgi:UDP-galactopyranose mutase